ncbi:hypothetical protein M513_13578 [Trichuris suis]|uniref:Uncharacterized protein n=1 Tax=Trichuris suis TaxID=68888 RepID=A0A085LKP7_9BILA|nr:hypothetical protein M513_13578 [Trichuris suis]
MPGTPCATHSTCVKLLVLKVEHAKRKSLMSFALSRSEDLYTGHAHCSIHARNALRNPEYKKEQTNSVRAAQRNLLYPYLQQNGCTGVAVDVGSIDRSFAAASMPGTPCATHSTWYVKPFSFVPSCVVA